MGKCFCSKRTKQTGLRLGTDSEWLLKTNLLRHIPPQRQFGAFRRPLGQRLGKCHPLKTEKGGLEYRSAVESPRLARIRRPCVWSPELPKTKQNQSKGKILMLTTLSFKSLVKWHRWLHDPRDLEKVRADILTVAQLVSSAGCCSWASAVSPTEPLSSQATQLSKREQRQMCYVMLMSSKGDGLVGFCYLDTNLDISGKTDSQLRKYLYQTAL